MFGSRLIVPGLLVLVLSACSPSGSSASGDIAAFGPTPVPVPAGQSMTNASHHSVTMLDYHRGSSTRPGKQCVRVSVNLANSDSAGWLMPLNGIQLLDARGFLYYPSDDCGTNATLQNLGPGQSTSVVLYFEILANGTVDFNWAPKIGDPGYSTPLR